MRTDLRPFLPLVFDASQQASRLKVEEQLAAVHLAAGASVARSLFLSNISPNLRTLVPNPNPNPNYALARHTPLSYSLATSLVSSPRCVSVSSTSATRRRGAVPFPNEALQRLTSPPTSPPCGLQRPMLQVMSPDVSSHVSISVA
eukprot:3548323-Pleurochrysis_carterae.AAC.1